MNSLSVASSDMPIGLYERILEIQEKLNALNISIDMFEKALANYLPSSVEGSIIAGQPKPTICPALDAIDLVDSQINHLTNRIEQLRNQARL